MHRHKHQYGKPADLPSAQNAPPMMHNTAYSAQRLTVGILVLATSIHSLHL